MAGGGDDPGYVESDCIRHNTTGPAYIDGGIGVGRFNRFTQRTLVISRDDILQGGHNEEGGLIGGACRPISPKEIKKRA